MKEPQPNSRPELSHELQDLTSKYHKQVIKRCFPKEGDKQP